jgi:uncharacterized membrane protein YfcA
MGNTCPSLPLVPRVAQMNGADLAWIAGCIAFASFAQSLSGFGFSLLAVPLMTLVVSPRDAVVVATIMSIGKSPPG